MTTYMAANNDNIAYGADYSAIVRVIGAMLHERWIISAASCMDDMCPTCVHDSCLFACYVAYLCAR